MNPEQPIRLHLGCGENYLAGYTNVDLPVEHQTVMQTRADLYADVRTLNYAENSVSEVRTHHMLEHFSRQEAIKLLLRWRRWLRADGVLHVETPDFEEGVKRFTSGNMHTKFAVARHLFGSQEAAWAFHLDWWGEEKFRFVLPRLGYEIIELEKRASYLGRIPIEKVGAAINRFAPESVKNATGDRLDNIIVKAKKMPRVIDERAAARDILSCSLVGTEKKTLEVWIREIFPE